MHPEDQQRLAHAFAFALEAHGPQQRKGIGVPYASHLLQVAGLVQEHGGDVEQTMAAFLHDTIEDCEAVTFEALDQLFGRDVASIVRDCTDTLPDEPPEAKRPWKQRKLEYLDHLKSAPERSVLVGVCDKLHNLRATLIDLGDQGPGFFERFNAGPEDQLWYVEGIQRHTRGRVPQRLERELQRCVVEFGAFVAKLR